MDPFVVSARKYRPATFQSVVGQSHISSTLKNAITRGQLAHAYLFCGPRGVGKTTCARIFAKAINCLSPADGEACNECESCKSFNEGRSFNIHELDAASNNSVDDIRNLTEQVRIQPQVGRYSVYIIDEVHMLSLSAFNAFLKTLEEPPAHAVFILATTEKHKIIPTILSRCQIYDFNRIRVEDGVEYLKYIAAREKVTYDEESLHIIAQKADGGMRDALSMFDKVVSFCGNELTGKNVADTLNVLDYDTYFRITESILAGDYTGVLVIFDDVLRKGFPGQTFVGGLNSHLRNLLMCKNPQTLPLLEVTGAIADRYLDQSQHCSLPFLFESVNLLSSVDSGFRTATNQRLHVELGLMKLCGMGQKKNVADSEPTDERLKPVLPEPVTSAFPTSPPGTSTEKSEAAGRPIPPEVAPVAEESGRPDKPGAMSGHPEHPTAPANSGPYPPVLPESSVSGPGSASVPSARTVEKKTPDLPSSPDVPPAREPEPRIEDPAPAAAEPADTAVPAAGAPPSITGFSLKNLMAETRSAEDIPDPGPAAESLPTEPEDLGETLPKACAELSQELLQNRPRLAAAFNGLRFEGNRIFFTVANDSIREEIERNSLELKKRLSEIGGFLHPVEFVIETAPRVRTEKPVNPEDKLRFLLQRNRHLAEFKKALHLDIE